MKKILVLVIFSLVFINVFPQKIIKVYSYERITNFLSKDTLKIYYIIDSSKVLIFNKTKFYGFTFAVDTSDISGYITYEKKTGRIYFLSKFYRQNKMNCINALYSQLIFDPKKTITNRICYLGFIGSNFQFETSNSKNGIAIKVKYLEPILSHRTYIKSLDFEGRNYPSKIVFCDSVMGDIIVYPHSGLRCAENE